MKMVDFTVRRAGFLNIDGKMYKDIAKKVMSNLQELLRKNAHLILECSQDGVSYMPQELRIGPYSVISGLMKAIHRSQYMFTLQKEKRRQMRPRSG